MSHKVRKVAELSDWTQKGFFFQIGETRGQQQKAFSAVFVTKTHATQTSRKVGQWHLHVADYLAAALQPKEMYGNVYTHE